MLKMWIFVQDPKIGDTSIALGFFGGYISTCGIMHVWREPTWLATKSMFACVQTDDLL